MAPMTSTANTGAMVDVLLVIVGRVILPESRISVSDEVHKRNGEGASSHWLAFNVAQLRRAKTEMRREIEGQYKAAMTRKQRFSLFG